MSDSTLIESSPAPPSDSLRAYLADRDIPCPGCGYNLRGTQDPVCPECGGPIELTVTRAASGRGWLLLLLLALGWVFLAAGMHTTRTALAARDEARVVSGFQVLFSSTTMFRGGTTVRPGATIQPLTTINRSTLGTTTGSGRSPVTTTIGGGGAVSQPGGFSVVTRTPTAGNTVSSGPVTITTQPGGGVSFATGTPAMPTSGATMAWSQVQTQTWVSLAISTLLAILAAVALFIVLFRRRKIVHAGPSRHLITFSLAVFAVYATGQVFLFARDLAG